MKVDKMISTSAILTTIKNEMARKKTSGTMNLAMLEIIEDVLSTKGVAIDGDGAGQPEHGHMDVFK